jgi:hypothetical protein
MLASSLKINSTYHYNDMTHAKHKHKQKEMRVRGIKKKPQAKEAKHKHKINATNRNKGICVKEEKVEEDNHNEEKTQMSWQQRR